MKITVPAGTYVVAVSGGIDSMVLLDLVSQQADSTIIVTHFNHGIREDAIEDAKLVAKKSQEYGVDCEIGSARLGKRASEDQARQARYDFLRKVCKKYRADAIITAHHQDDALETLAFNVLRGTKRKGVSALQSQPTILRPLLGYTKADITTYAHKHKIAWREDSTNSDDRYARNWLRHQVITKLTPDDKARLTNLYQEMTENNRQLDVSVAEQFDRMMLDGGIDRHQFMTLPYIIAAEVMAVWLQQMGCATADRRLIDRLVVSAKTLSVGKKITVNKSCSLLVGSRVLYLQVKGR